MVVSDIRLEDEKEDRIEFIEKRLNSLEGGRVTLYE